MNGLEGMKHCGGKSRGRPGSKMVTRTPSFFIFPLSFVVRGTRLMLSRMMMVIGLLIRRKLESMLKISSPSCLQRNR